MSGEAASSPAAVRLGKLSGYIGYQIRQAQSALFRDLAAAKREIGLTPGEFSLLTLVQENPDLNMTTLARAYGLDKATLSLALKRLTKRKLIRSIRRSQDRRYRALRLTVAGRSALRRATRRIEKQERVMDSVLLAGERELILNLLQRITAAVSR